MATPNNFIEYYKTISNTELLSILENPVDYQSSAVEAAKKEFSNRQLSEKEINEAKESLILNQIKKEKQRIKIKAIEDKVKTTGYTLIETLNPIQSGIPSTEKTIRLIVIVFGGLFLYEFIKDFRTHLLYIKDIPGFPLLSILYLLPLILLFIGTFTFWKRKLVGWILLTIFLTFSIIGALSLLIDSFSWKSSSYASLDNLFPRASPTVYIIQLAFLSGTQYVLCKSNIREVFSINRQKMITTIGLTGLVTFILLLSL